MSLSPRHNPGTRRRLGRSAAAAVVVAAVLAGSGATVDGAPETVARAEAALAAARAERVAHEAKVLEVELRHREMAQELEQLGRREAQLTADLAAARRDLREFAVAAYVDRGRAEVLMATLDLEQAQLLAWQTHLLAGQSMSADEAARRFEAQRDATTPERLALAERLDRVQDELTAARNDAIQASALERDAEAELARRRAAARAAEDAARAAAQARAAAARDDQRRPPKPATPAAPVGAASAPHGLGNPTAAEAAILAKIRHCESRGNYSIVSPTGRYRGAYQFDLTTWRSVGGSGDPAAASPAEQDHRALVLLRQRGTRPWPHCGR